MHSRKTLAAVVVAAALTVFPAATGAAEDEDVCVWSNELQRWVCVPPED